MIHLEKEHARSINGGKYISYDMWVATYMGQSFKWQNPTGTFYYIGKYPNKTAQFPYLYRSPNVWVPGN